jgi:hypothetical protein
MAEKRCFENPLYPSFLVISLPFAVSFVMIYAWMASSGSGT